MSESPPQTDTPKNGIVGNILAYVTRAVEDADAEAAAERVAALRKAHPGAGEQELVDMLIKQKCRRTGAVGAVTSGTTLVPGLGTLASLTLGAAADVRFTFGAQVELILEIAAVYGQRLDPAERKQVVKLATGVSSGTNRLLGHAGGLVVGRATRRFTRRFFIKAIPVFGVGASVAGNILATQVIGQRANAYFRRGRETMRD